MPKPKLPDEVRKYLSLQGTKGGKIGGKRSLETMTPEARTARAKKAARRSVIVRKKKVAAHV